MIQPPFDADAVALSAALCFAKRGGLAKPLAEPMGACRK
jgi:hypothetical protein